MPVVERDQLLGAVGTHPDHHQQAHRVLGQADLEADSVDPHLDVVGVVQRPSVERLRLLLPLGWVRVPRSRVLANRSGRADLRASTSTTIGSAPRYRNRTTSAVVVYVHAGTITSSPGPMPSASSARWKPAVAELTATASRPTAEMLGELPPAGGRCQARSRRRWLPGGRWSWREGDALDVVTESGTGVTALPGDAESIASAIRRACDVGRDGLATLGMRARTYYDATFSVERGVECCRRAARGRNGDEGTTLMVEDAMAGATVAITGGTGSFGTTMAGHLLQRGVGAVHVLSRDEAKQDAMRTRFGDSRLKFFLGDVRDPDSVANAFVGTDYVFHAAALKQVPSCEFFPQQAVKTNVVGSHNVIEAAAAVGVRSVVCLSTDKAVYPVNAMGMSKALMEKTAQAFARSHPGSRTTVSLTRYGNVMYSRGSVIPLFVKQLQEGRPLTITEPGMTRFLMSLEESVDLVEYAFSNAEPGDLFVRKAPACTMEVLARAIASVLGVHEPEVRVIGTRHGEKLHETLLSREEMVKAEDHDRYFRVPVDARSLQYELYVEEGEHATADLPDYTSENTERLDVAATSALLMTVPEIRALVEHAR